MHPNHTFRPKAADVFYSKFTTGNFVVSGMYPPQFVESLPLNEPEKGLFFESLHENPPVSIRKNLKKNSHLFTGTAIPWCGSGLYLNDRPKFIFDPLWHAGAYYVQEASSMFLEQIVLQLGLNQNPIKVLDACAAPGGKSTHLLSLLHEDSLLVANEAIAARAGLLVENSIRWGYPNLVVSQNDAGKLGLMEGYFDAIFCDAPCSGEGLFRKDQRAIQEWSEKNVMFCATRQQRIVNDLWPSLKPGGFFIYSTCTYNTIENEKNVLQFLREFNAEAVKLNIADFNGIEECVAEGAVLYRFFPHKVKGEGFTIAIIKKSESSPTSITAVKGRKMQFSNKHLAMKGNDVLIQDNNWTYFIHNNGLRVIPESIEKQVSEVLNLNAIHVGTQVFTINQQKYLPSHELALSVLLKKDSFPSYDTDWFTALKLLKGETRILDQINSGISLITYKNTPLMFINKLNHRLNSFYPRSWLIRLPLPEM